MMGSGNEVVVIDWWPSPFAMRVKIALTEKEVEFESREEDLLNSKSNLLLKMNHVNKKIPVLIHKGKPICESLNIVQYIDDVWNHKSPLLPSHDPYQRAHARFWGDYIDKKIYPIGGKLWLTKEAEVKEAAKKELMDCLKVLEGELGEKPYYAGGYFGYVDVALIPFYCLFYTFEKLGGFSIEAECPKLIAWTKRCMQKKSVSQILCDPYKLYHCVLDIKKKLGT